MMSPHITKCAASFPSMSILACVDVMMAIAHVVVAIYFQCRLISSLKMPEADQEANGGGGRQKPHDHQANMMNQATHIMMYDIGFCLYMLLLIASLVLNIQGFFATWDCSYEYSGFLTWSSMLHLAFLGILVLVALLWFCIVGCQEKECCEDCNPFCCCERRNSKGRSSKVAV